MYLYTLQVALDLFWLHQQNAGSESPILSRIYIVLDLVQLPVRIETPVESALRLTEVLEKTNWRGKHQRVRRLEHVRRAGGER